MPKSSPNQSSLNSDGSISIHISRGAKAIIDPIDGDLCDYHWHCTTQLRACRHTGARKSQTDIFLHRVVLERMIGRPLVSAECVDHIDGDTLNNRRSNLRLATLAQNTRNKRKSVRNKSGYKGVCQEKNPNRWRAQIQVNGHKQRLGGFDSPEEAHEAYIKAAKELHGEFARFE